MITKEIFSDTQTEAIIKDFSVFVVDMPKHTLTKAIFHSVILHLLLFGIALFIAKILTYILLMFGINLDMFKRPEMKIKDIDFVFVLPQKYDIKKSFLKVDNGATYSLAGPNPNNRPYNGDEGSLKSEAKDKNLAKDKIVNTKPLEQTKQVASQTTIPLSKTPKKGSYIPKAKEPGAFTANIPDAEMNTDLGWGTQGSKGYHSPTAGNASFKAGGAGAGGTGVGDSVGNGTTKGGGYYYGAAGAPRPQTASSYKNEAADVDLRPYATELQRRVSRNWATTGSDNSKKTVLFIRIAKNGNLMILNVKTPSGDTYTDNLAIGAVKKAQPFSPLPSAYRNPYADFILTLDYNVSARTK